MKKRLLSSFMAFLMVCSLVMNLPTMNITASAANTADSLIAIAEGELGSTNYSKYYGGHAGAWCADFVSWCAQQAGVSSIALNSSCYYMYQGMKNNGCQEVSSPQRGDIVFYYCNSCTALADRWCHVGIMTGPNSSIEGNSWSNNASRVVAKNPVTYSHKNGSHTYNHSGTNVVTVKYLRPNYTAPTPTNHAPIGYIDNMEGCEGYIHLRGWAYDPDNMNAELNIHVYVGGKSGESSVIECHDNIYANQDSTDLYTSSGITGKHRFDVWIKTSARGNQQINVYAIDTADWRYNCIIQNGTGTVNINNPENPVIKDIKITNKSTTGYTVECTVTDSGGSGLDRVQFPTWTTANGQDDLSSDWGSNSKYRGTISGNKVTYRVNISDHNNEYGTYRTHIYAYDKVGNQGWASVSDVSVGIGHEMSETEGAGQTLADGDYWILSELGLNVYLDIPGAAYPATSGNKLIATNGSALPPLCDSWTLTYLNNGFYKITQNGQDIAIDVPYASLNHKTKLQTHEDNESIAQQWSIKETDHGYTIQSRSNGYYLDVANATIGNDGYLQTHEGNNSKTQSWCFVPFKSDDRPIADGEYYIKSAVGDLWIDADGNGAYADKTNIQINNSKSDSFKVSYVGEGYYKILESTTGLSVDIADSGEAEYLKRGQNIQLYKYSEGKRNHLWRIVDEGNGYYRFVSKYNGYSLDLKGMGTTNGTNIQSHPYNTSNAQKWILEEVHEHIYTEKVVPATCTSKGYTLHTCTVCGDSFKDNETDYAAHKFGAWTTTVEPTTTSEGTAVHKCTVCGKEETKTLDKLPQEVDPNAPQIVVESVTTSAGQTVKVNVNIKNNPGISNCLFKVGYDKNVMTLVGAESKDLGTLLNGSVDESPYIVSWTNPVENSNVNGTIVELTFKIKENTSEGTYPLTIDYDEDDIYAIVDQKGNTENVHFEAVSGEIKVIDYLPGDINMDGKVNMKDVTRLHQYVVKWPVEVNLAACDTNGDGKINMKDVTRLHQYVVKWPVEIH